MFKKVICLIMLVCFLAQGSVLAEEATPRELKENTYVFQGYAEINEDLKEEDKLFTGETTTVDKGTVVNMVVSNVISSESTVKGDEFFAEITNDIETDQGIVVQKGSIAHGSVTDLEGSKRLGRDGYVTLDFDYIATPDGREIPISARMTTKRHPVAQTAKIVGENSLYTLGGGLMGGYMALNGLGIEAAVASHGYTVAGGAAIGGLVGLGVGLARKGKSVLLSPGDALNVKIMGAMKLPIMNKKALREDEIHLDGLDVKITGFQVEKDPFGEPNTITIMMVVVNKTDRTFSSFDIALVNDAKAVYYASPFGDTELWFTKIEPNSRIAGKMSFSVDNPKRKYWLVFYDSRKRKPVAKISVDNAIRDINDMKKKSKKKNS